MAEIFQCSSGRGIRVRSRAFTGEPPLFQGSEAIERGLQLQLPWRPGDGEQVGVLNLFSIVFADLFQDAVREDSGELVDSPGVEQVEGLGRDDGFIALGAVGIHLRQVEIIEDREPLGASLQYVDAPAPAVLVASGARVRGDQSISSFFHAVGGPEGLEVEPAGDAPPSSRGTPSAPTQPPKERLSCNRTGRFPNLRPSTLMLFSRKI